MRAGAPAAGRREPRQGPSLFLLPLPPASAPPARRSLPTPPRLAPHTPAGSRHRRPPLPAPGRLMCTRGLPFARGARMSTLMRRLLTARWLRNRPKQRPSGAARGCSLGGGFLSRPPTRPPQLPPYLLPLRTLGWQRPHAVTTVAVANAGARPVGASPAPALGGRPRAAARRCSGRASVPAAARLLAREQSRARLPLSGPE